MYTRGSKVPGFNYKFGFNYKNAFSKQQKNNKQKQTKKHPKSHNGSPSCYTSF